MGNRIELQGKLEAIMGNRNVYFQPPESIRITYPCIIYNLANENVGYADDSAYKVNKQYTVMIIDKNPDSALPDKLRDSFTHCSFDRAYASENLNHFVYTLYF